MNEKTKLFVSVAARVIAFAGLAAMLGGCQSKRAATSPEYPNALRQSVVTNVQVLRDDTQISMTNTSGRAFGPGRMWLNGEYSRDFEAWDVGRTRTYELSTFVNEYGQAYRAGGFFATEPTYRLVLAQLEIDGELLGLIVIEPND